MMRFFRLWFVWLLFILALAACNGQATNAPLPDAQSVLNKSASEIQNAKSFKVKLQRTGAPAYVDTANTIGFVSADGYYVAPDKVSASVVATIMGLPGQVDVIAIGDDQWMYNQVLTAGQWIRQVFSPGFNPREFISSAKGVQGALIAFKDVKMVGRENVEGQDMYHITGKAAGNDVNALTFGLIRGTDVNIDIYIVTDTGRVDRIIMVQPNVRPEKEPTSTTWTTEFFDYDSPAEITPPPAMNQATLEATASSTDIPSTESPTELATSTIGQ